MTAGAVRPGRLARWRAWLGDVFLGTDPARRGPVARCLLSGATYLASLIGEALGAEFGLTDRIEVAGLAAYMASGAVFFYVLIRSGRSQRFADPSMILGQHVFALSVIAASYPVNGPLRGLNLLMVTLPPMFGFLAIGWSWVVGTIVAIPLVFGPMMALLAWLDPLRFNPRVELMHFVILSITMPALGALLSQVRRMGKRVQAQKVELSDAMARIELVSTRDALTGLCNRRRMTLRLDDEVARRARGGAPFCVCLIDLDHFKGINDRHGHARGDAVLRRFAQIVQAALREGEVLARWGGEEFLLLLPTTTAADAGARLARLRAEVLDASRWGAEADLGVRFSAGLAEDDGAPFVAVLERADRALYRAKAGGRDRIAQDEPLQPA